MTGDQTRPAASCFRPAHSDGLDVSLCGAWQTWNNFDTARIPQSRRHVSRPVFAVFATPTLLPITDILVKYGHLLIGYR